MTPNEQDEPRLTDEEIDEIVKWACSNVREYLDNTASGKKSQTHWLAFFKTEE